MKQWEYKVVELAADARSRTTSYHDVLRRLGEEGWELVRADDPVHNTARNTVTETRLAFFKRLKSDPDFDLLLEE